MPYKIDPKTKKRTWISEADIPKTTPPGEPVSPEFRAGEEQVKRRKMMEAEKARIPPSFYEVQKEKEAGEIREEAFEEETGAGALQEELKGKIEEPLSLKPEIQDIVPTGLEGIETPEEKISRVSNLSEIPSMAKRFKAALPDAAKTLGAMVAGGGAAIAIFSLPYIMGKIASAKIATSVGTNSKFITGAATGIISLVIGGKIVDLKGGEISNLRAGIAKIPGQSSTILSAVQNGGLTKEEGIIQLRALAATVDEAERAIKQAGIYSLVFRYNKEYIPIMQEIKDARLNIIERVGGVETVAATGRPTLTPEELLFEAELEGGET